MIDFLVPCPHFSADIKDKIVLSSFLLDLGYVGAGMPTTDSEAREFAANATDPVRHLRNSASG